MREFGIKNMLNEVVNNRAGSALYITVFLIILIAEFAAIMELKVEAANPAANLTTAGDAVWWVFVTITTVGYGDFYPTTGPGLIIGICVMLSDIPLTGVLPSFLAYFFLAPSKKSTKPASDAADPKARLARMQQAIEAQEKALAALREDLGEVQGLLSTMSGFRSACAQRLRSRVHRLAQLPWLELNQPGGGPAETERHGDPGRVISLTYPPPPRRLARMADTQAHGAVTLASARRTAASASGLRDPSNVTRTGPRAQMTAGLLGRRPLSKVR
jgi:hypothetical protein